MERLWTVVVHIAYLLLAAISAAFLQTPLFSRLVLLLIVPLNAWAELQHHTSLSFLPMTMFILLTVLGKDYGMTSQSLMIIQMCIIVVFLHIRIFLFF